MESAWSVSQQLIGPGPNPPPNRAAGPIRVKCELAAPSGPSDQHRQNPN
jgi:hypothetical protein